MTVLSLRCPRCRTAFSKESPESAAIYCPQCRIAVPVNAFDRPILLPFQWVARNRTPLAAAVVAIFILGGAAWLFRRFDLAGLKDQLRASVAGESLSSGPADAKKVSTAWRGSEGVVPASPGPAEGKPSFPADQPKKEPIASTRDAALSSAGSGSPTASILVEEIKEPLLDPPAPTNVPLPSIQATAGWVSFGQAFPPGLVRDSASLVDLRTQVDVKNRWRDGSLRFAVFTARVPRPGAFTMQQGHAAQGKLAPKWPQAQVRFVIQGQTWTADLPGGPGDDFWLSGPLVVEKRHIVEPVDSQKKPHPILRVLFDARSYQDGAGRVDIAIENTLDVKEGGRVDYDVEIRINGKSRFRQAGVQHHYLTRWRKSFGIDLEEGQATPGLPLCQHAGAVPWYLSQVSVQSYSTSGPAFDLLGLGGCSNVDMAAPGGRPEIAPYPDWVARYFVHRLAGMREFTLRSGDLAGSWPIHARKPDGNFISLDEQPLFWLDARGQDDYTPAASRPRGNLQLTSPLKPDIAHQPSLAYVPYLLTGDRYCADEMAFWANYVLIGTWPGNGNWRRGALFVGEDVNVVQVRGMAWGLRNVADAAAYLPDGAPFKEYLIHKLSRNLAWLDRYAETHRTPLGTSFEKSEDGVLKIAQWQQNFLAWSIDHARRQGFAGGTRMRDRIVAFGVKLFSSSPDYPREYAAPGWPVVGTIEKSGNSETRRYLQTMKELFQSNYGKGEEPYPFEGYYGADARLSLMIGIQQGMPGAREACDFLSPRIGDDLSSRAGWALGFDPGPSR